MTSWRQTKDILLYKTYAELKVETQRHYLGLLWWVGEPLLFMLVYYFLFERLLKIRGGAGDDFIPFLLVGLVAWMWVQVNLSQGALSIRSNHTLLNQVVIPKYLLPTVVFLRNTVKFVFALCMLLTFLLFYGVPATFAWLYALPVLAVAGALILGASYLAAAFTPFYPDLELLINNGLRAGLFLSGIFYDINAFSAGTQALFRLNPAAVLIDALRGVLLAGQAPDWGALATILLLAFAVGGAGWAVMRRNESRYAKIAY